MDVTERTLAVLVAMVVVPDLGGPVASLRCR
jgi:hypothetical protein